MTWDRLILLHLFADLELSFSNELRERQEKW